VGPHDRCEGRVCAEKGKGVSVVKGGKEEVREFVKEQLRKGYIRSLKLLQIVPVFFVGKKDGKKWMV